MRNYTKMTYGPGDSEPDEDGDDDEEMRDLMRSDMLLDTCERCLVGKPRLSTVSSTAFVRLLAPVNVDDHASRRGDTNRSDRHAVNRLIAGLSEVKTLQGPKTLGAVDEMAAALFAEAPNFAVAIQAIRASAMASIRGGAHWLQIRPVIIESGPGYGKTRLVRLLAELCKLPIVHLDCASMTTLTAVLGQDSSWSHARSSEVMEALARGNVANPIVVLDELDKLKDHGRNAVAQASETLVGLFEKSSAANHLDHFTQLSIDMSFVNWVILVNDISRLSPPFVDRCLLIRLAAPTADQISQIAAREIGRRNLEPELLATITRAARKGRITSLRTLQKLLDAASAASARPLLN